jgi:transcriptional regulator with XRE-family HTH domain
MIAFNVVPLPGLRRQRILAALTQGELATRAGIQRGTVNRLEQGGEAEISTIRKLANALGCEPKTLIEPEP